jgi:hypothetical protein
MYVLSTATGMYCELTGTVLKIKKNQRSQKKDQNILKMLYFFIFKKKNKKRLRLF